MSTNNYNIRGFLNIKDENISFGDNSYFKKRINMVDTHVFYGVLSYIPTACPKCGVVHDGMNIVKYGFVRSSITMLPASNNPVILKLKKQRFFCKSCLCTFVAETNLVKRCCNISTDVKNNIFLSLIEKVSFKDLASRYYVSSNTILRTLRSKDKFFMPGFNSLPSVISMDEFKSVKNVSGAMSYIFTNPVTNDIIDILPDRRLSKLEDYFSNYSISERLGVSHIVCDMYAPYLSLAKSMFPNAEVIIDRFHIVQNFTRAFNHYRISLMKKYDTDSHEYRCLKRYWKLLLKARDKLDSIHFKKRYCFKKMISELEVVNHILDFNDEFKKAYEFIQGILMAVKGNNMDWFKSALEMGKEFLKGVEKIETAIRTAEKYEINIENALNTNYTNGGIEGIIGKIKVIKRVAFGYRNFLNLRMRILLSCYKFNKD